MSWRDRYAGDIGSFRGAEFVLESDTRSGGRRGVLHEYPLRDVPWAEDTGRRARRFTVRCFVLGPDFDTARDRLIQALEKSGSGTLIHPWYGTLQVAVLDEYSLEQSTREGGVARFSITFSEAGAKRLPDTETDTAAVVQTTADAADTAAANSFLAQYDVAGKPAWVESAAGERLAAMTDALDDLRSKMPTIPDELTNFVADLDDFAVELSGLIRDPLNLVARTADLISQLRVIAQRPLDAINAYKELFGFGDDALPVSPTTANRQAQANNQAAIHALVKTQATIAAARVAGTLTLAADGDLRDSAAARTLSDTLAAQLDTLMLSADDDSYAALYQLRNDIVTDLRRRALELPAVITYTPQQTEPAILIAFRRYGDAQRADDLAARNRVADPSFVPGGQPLEVLSQ